MNLDARLRAYAAFVRRKSFSGAAIELHISQPAVSKHIADLERELGVKLIERRMRSLTEAGEYISPKAKGLLAQIRDGSITDEKLDGLKSSFAPQDLQLRPSLRASGTGKSIKLGNSKNESLNFTLMKEEETYLLREFTISKAPAR